MRQFTEQEEKEICNLYQKEGKTKKYISTYFHCRNEAISFVLNKNNIPTKRKGCTKNRLLNENFFDNIDSEEKAYFLGLLFTDGSITLDSRRSPSIRLQLKISDEEILQKFKKLLNMDSEILYDRRIKKECAIISFRSKHMADSLSKYGIISQKTYKTNHLPNNIPEEFLTDFLRGLLDGDGSIYRETKSQKWRIDFCSYHKTICEDFRDLCNKYLDEENTNIIANYGSAFHIRFNKQSLVKQLATILYKNSKISLKRKYLLAEQIFEENNEEDIVYSDN